MGWRNINLNYLNNSPDSFNLRALTMNPCNQAAVCLRFLPWPPGMLQG